ncbi:type II toxin-antitoxin system RelE/ParE family toxin [Thalassospira alkalitolerans]|uniref:type II toxin-antitoxin system RelE/ParE family toxin n=1 Tax=Thalassospira alkalitolerans TaxID=1293890 RepID=UPI000A1F411B|nr:type II toxin-antitoxin system RelE/ParE family toxin [Thalassospira alkalitolerans]
MANSFSITLTGPARNDLLQIREYTQRTYGRAAADAYDALLRQAFKDIRDDPYRPGSKERSEIGGNIRSFHTSLSRKRASSYVKAPRHFVLYFIPSDNEVAVSRVLHDARDLARHLPEKHLDQLHKFKEKRESDIAKKGRSKRPR